MWSWLKSYESEERKQRRMAKEKAARNLILGR
jgi:hypothetical protein